MIIVVKGGSFNEYFGCFASAARGVLMMDFEIALDLDFFFFVLGTVMISLLPLVRKG